MKQILFILLSLIILQNTSFAIEKEDLITFHPPQTEAEEALDVMLRIDNGLMKGENNDNIFTKNFIIDDDKQQKKASDEDPEVPCLLRASGRNCGFLTSGNDYITDIGFLYYTIRIKDDITYIYMLPQGFKNDPDRKLGYKTKFLKKEFRRTIFSNYAMKKENGKWQLDGLCHSSIAVNHKYCWSFFRPTFY